MSRVEKKKKNYNFGMTIESSNLGKIDPDIMHHEKYAL
jgi:hypothetical protein